MKRTTRNQSAKLMESALRRSRREPDDDETLASVFNRQSAKLKANRRQSEKRPVLIPDDESSDDGKDSEKFANPFAPSSDEEMFDDTADPREGVPQYPLYEDLETRYLENRRAQVVWDRMHPEYTHPNHRVIGNFTSSEAKDRYDSLRVRSFHNQKYLPLDDSKLIEVRKILDQSGLIYTVMDVEPYCPNVIHEFYANVPDLEYHNDVNRLYIRGQMYEFTPEIINRMFLIDESLAHGEWDKLNIDEAVRIVSGGRKHRWEGFGSRHLQPVNGVLYKLCCCNWMPSSNKTTMVKERVKFLAFLLQRKKFNFGQLVYDQILTIARTPDMVDRKLMFPNLIYQLLKFQRTVPTQRGDRDLQGFPIRITLDPKAGKGSEDDEPAMLPSLGADLDQLARWLKRIQLRLQGGEYTSQGINTVYDDESGSGEDSETEGEQEEEEDD